MARRSRKKVDITENISSHCKEKIYSAALYARISVETERKREADTIGNQLQLLKNYVSEQMDIKVFDAYIDDNISGTDFTRPEFSRMLNDMRDGRVDCIIVKDLSRLGRNHLEAGEYIEFVFPFFDVRFISINDHFDTKTQQADITVQFKNLANEMYAKDISRKICSTMSTIQQQGKFAGSRPPYGYLQHPDDKHLLIVDDETAPIVREMYEMVADGKTLHYIATTLNERGIPSPGRLLYERGRTKLDKFKNAKWYYNTIRTILSNQIYLGWMVSGKYRSKFYESGIKGSKSVPAEEWIITRGTHEPIVTEELFNKVQAYFIATKEKRRIMMSYNSAAMKSSIFKGHLRCGECGKAMQLRSKKNNRENPELITWWYYCPLHENYNSSYCIKKAIKKENLESIALRLIKIQIQLFTDACSVIAELNQREGSKTKYKVYLDQIQSVNRKIERYVSLKASLYEDYSNGLLTQNDYMAMGQEYARKADEMRIFLAELEKEAEKYSPDFASSGQWAKMIEDYQYADHIDEKMVDAFIDEMIVYNDGHVEISFNFKDELDEVIHLSAIRNREVERYAV